MPSLEVQNMLLIHTPKLHHQLRVMVMDTGSQNMMHKLHCSSRTTSSSSLMQHKAMHPISTIGLQLMACPLRLPLLRVMPLPKQVSLLLMHLIRLLFLQLNLMAKMFLHSSNIHKLLMVLHQ